VFCCLPLTKDQIDAVLKSLKVPIPLKGEKSSCEHSDDSTDLKSSNKRLAIDSDSESAPKKFKVEFPSPPSDDDGEQKILSEGSKTPKALHKTQEFSGNTGIPVLIIIVSDFRVFPSSSHTRLPFLCCSTICLAVDFLFSGLAVGVSP
jgi:hypothetical protein